MRRDVIMGNRKRARPTIHPKHDSLAEAIDGAIWRWLHDFPFS
jgi:hypothetical protein